VVVLTPTAARKFARVLAVISGAFVLPVVMAAVSACSDSNPAQHRQDTTAGSTSEQPRPSVNTSSAVAHRHHHHHHRGSGAVVTGCHARNQHKLPDRHCTPGAVNQHVTQANIASTICRAGWTDSVRPDESYTEALKIRQIHRYGYANTDPSSYEEDHLIPLELGGSPASPENLWPEYDGGQIPNPKDSVENALNNAVCDGTVSLRAAQYAIAVNWMRAESRLGISGSGGSGGSGSGGGGAPAGCHPKTASGSCYEPGEFCRDSDHGVVGVAGNGEAIKCEDTGSGTVWHWEPV